MTNAILRGKPDAGNPHVRFDEGEVASAKPRRGSLLYKNVAVFACAAAVLAFARTANAADVVLDEDLVIDGSTVTNLTDNYSGPGGIRIVNHAPGARRQVSFEGYLTRYCTDEGAMVITNAWLLDVQPVSATAKGKSMSTGAYTWIGNRVDHLGASAMYSTIECQRLEGTSIKTVSMRLTQAGDNVIVSYSHNDSGVQYLSFVDAATAASYIGVINYHEGRKDSLTPSSCLEYVNNYSTQTYATSDTEGLYGIHSPVLEVSRDRLVTLPGYVKEAKTTLLSGAFYRTVRPVVGYVRGGSILKALFGSPMTFCHRRENRSLKYVEWQAHFAENTSVKCVMVRLTQSGDDVVVSSEWPVGWTAKCFYRTFADAAEAMSMVGVWDFVEDTACKTMGLSDADDANGDPEGGYGITNVLFACEQGTVHLQGDNSFTGGITVDGACHLIADGGRTSLSSGNTVIVTNGATLVMSATGCSQSDGVNADVRIGPGSRLLTLPGKNWNTGGTHFKVTVDGGTYECWNSANYVANLWLRNGATLDSMPDFNNRFRVGLYKIAGEDHLFLKSEGAGTNFVTASIQLYRNGNDHFGFDCDAPLLVTGLLGLNGDGENYTLNTLYKRGAEELILRGSPSENRAEWRLLEGVTRLEADCQLWASNSLYLAGGDLVCAAATSNGVKALSINASAQNFPGQWAAPADAGGEIVFEPGAKLTVAEKGATWPAADVNRITLKGELANANFRVGTTRCLTAADLCAFAYEDTDGETLRVRQDDDGYLLPKPKEGLILLVR